MDQTAFETLLLSYQDNEAALTAIRLIKHSNASVFLTGSAGTGKTSLAQQIRQCLHKNLLLLSPSTEDAIQIGGQSLFSFFGFSAAVFVPNQHKLAPLSAEKIQILAQTELIMIEDIGTLRCDQMQRIDETLRHYLDSKLPFAGKQMVLVGDLYQLPPKLDHLDKNSVQLLRSQYSSRYFFGATCFDQNFKIHLVELQVNYRHKTPLFTEILSAVRLNKLDQSQLDTLNTRSTKDHSLHPLYQIMLCSQRDIAEQVNREQLEQLEGPQLNFKAAIAGIQVDKLQYPSDFILSLKIGAQVVFVSQDPQKRWNKGSLGIVHNIFENQVEISLFSGKEQRILKLERQNWPIINYQWNTSSNSIEPTTLGTFSQFPIRLGWSISVHQAQGFCFEKIYLKLDRRSFAAGETYAALSRCSSLKGVYLNRAFLREDIFSDKRIARFLDAGNKKNIRLTHTNYTQQVTIIEALEIRLAHIGQKQHNVGYQLSEQAQKIAWQTSDIQAAQKNLKSVEQKLADTLQQIANKDKQLEQTEKTKVSLQMFLAFLILVVLCIFFS